MLCVIQKKVSPRLGSAVPEKVVHFRDWDTAVICQTKHISTCAQGVTDIIYTCALTISLYELSMACSLLRVRHCYIPVLCMRYIHVCTFMCMSKYMYLCK